jgi:hypothetical protein
MVTDSIISHKDITEKSAETRTNVRKQDNLGSKYIYDYTRQLKII